MQGQWFSAYRENTYWLSSGKAALAGALSVAKFSRKCKRPEVIVPAYACPDVVRAAESVGVRPVPVDFVPGLPWLDPERVLEAITAETIAVIYFRFLGLPANDRELRSAIGSTSDSPLLIEDSAHIFPTGSAIQSSADFVALSFGRGKPVSIGLGGALIDIRSRCDSKGIRPPPPKPARCGVQFRLKFLLSTIIRNWLIRPGSYAIAVGLLGVKTDRLSYTSPVRYEELPPCLGTVLANALAIYLRNGDEQEQFLRGLLKTSGNSSATWTDLDDQCRKRALNCGSAQNGKHRLWRYPLLFASVKERDRIYQALWKKGLGPSLMYEVPLTEMRQLSGRIVNTDSPIARDFAGRLLTLPVHNDVRDCDYFQILKCMEDFD